MIVGCDIDALTPEERRRHAIELELAWRFHYADAESCSVPSGLEVLIAVCMSGGPVRGGGTSPTKIGLPFTQRLVDAIDRARRIDRILAMLESRHVAALRARYDERDLPDAVRGVFPYDGDGAVAYVTPAAQNGFARASGDLPTIRAAHELPRWFEAACLRVVERCATAEDEQLIDDVRHDIAQLVVAAFAAYAAAAARFDVRDRRLWVA